MLVKDFLTVVLGKTHVSVNLTKDQIAQYIIDTQDISNNDKKLIRLCLKDGNIADRIDLFDDTDLEFDIKDIRDIIKFGYIDDTYLQKINPTSGISFSNICEWTSKQTINMIDIDYDKGHTYIYIE